MRHRALSSVYGKIRTLLLCDYLPRALSTDDLLARYDSIVGGFSVGTGFRFLVNHDGVLPEAQTETTLRNLLQTRFPAFRPGAAGREFVLLGDPDIEARAAQFLRHMARIECEGDCQGCDCHIALKQSHGHSRWAQDPFSVIQYRNGTHALLKPGQFGVFWDQFLPDMLATEDSFVLKPMRWHSEGGNLLVGDDYALIGTDTLKANLAAFPALSVEEISDGLARALGLRRIIWVGYDPEAEALPDQPMFHIDLYLTLGGRMEGKERVYVAEPLGAGETNLAAALDAQADWLARAGFAVARLPIVVYAGIPYSYNNCLVEVYGPVRRLYLPHYTTAASDGTIREPELEALLRQAQEKAVAAFRQDGFEVVTIQKNMLWHARERGALNCLTKVLRRDFEGWEAWR